MQPKHVVVIEDDKELLGIQQEILTHAGYHVTAIDQIQSLEALLTLGADCFIMDEQLPNVSGHIACIYLRSKPVTMDVPVILVSSHPRVGQYSELGGADAWLAKPFNLEKLLDTVKRLVG